MQAMRPEVVSSAFLADGRRKRMVKATRRLTRSTDVGGSEFGQRQKFATSGRATASD